MKPFSFIFFFWIALFSSGPVQASKAKLPAPEEAEKLYAEKKYKEVIILYESILAEGLSSYKLHYNLGNAYYKNKQLGKAIYQYELARKLKPDNEDVLTNLRIANEKTIDKIESKENFFFGVIKSSIVNALSTSGWAWLSVTSLVVSLVLLFLFFVSQRIALKRMGFFAGLLFLAVFIVSMILGYTELHDKQNNRFAIITAPETKTHEEPSNTSGSKFSLHEGTRVRVLETTTDWTNIKLENGNEAWIRTADAGLF